MNDTETKAERPLDTSCPNCGKPFEKCWDSVFRLGTTGCCARCFTGEVKHNNEDIMRARLLNANAQADE